MQLKPCTAFASNTPYDQLKHVEEEMTEVKKAFYEWRIAEEEPTARTAFMHLGEELTDLQTTCETMLMVIGFDAQARNKFKIDVAQKNWKRGYFKEV